MDAVKPAEKLWNRSYILMLSLNILTFTGFMMISPLLAPYALDMGASLPFASLIAGMFAVTALVARPVAGLAVDRFNKKHLFHLANALLMVTTFLYVLAPSFQALLPIRILHGLFFALSSTAATSLATSFIPRDKLGQGIGYLGITYILGSGIGPNLGIIVRDSLGYRAAYLAATALFAVAVLLMFLLKSAPAASRGPAAIKAKIRPSDLVAPELLLLSALTACFTLLNGLISNYILLLADERGIKNVSYFFTLSMVVLLVIRPLTGYLNDRKPLSVILVPAFVMAIAAAVLLGLARTLPVVLIAAVVYAFGQGAGTPSIQTTCLRRLGPERVGVATSTYFIGMDFGQGVGAIIGGSAAAFLGSFSYVFLGAGAILLLGLTVFLITGRRQKNAEAIAEPVLDA